MAQKLYVYRIYTFSRPISTEVKMIKEAVENAYEKNNNISLPRDHKTEWRVFDATHLQLYNNTTYLPERPSELIKL